MFDKLLQLFHVKNLQLKLASNLPIQVPQSRAAMLPIPLGSKLSAFLPNWEQIFGPEAWACSVVRNGYWLEVLSHRLPAQHFLPDSYPEELEERKVLEAEIQAMVAEKCVQRVPRQNLSFICRLFLVPKPDQGVRPVINLRALNRAEVYHHFKMEGLATLKMLLQKECWMAKLDLKSAYWHVPLNPSAQRWVGFHYHGEFFQFLTLPFGLSSAPRIFTKVLRLPVELLRMNAVPMVMYLDDMIIIGATEKECLTNLALTVGLLTALGFSINLKKSVLSPSQEIEFLGWTVNSAKMTISLPARKVEKYGVCVQRC